MNLEIFLTVLTVVFSTAALTGFTRTSILQRRNNKAQAADYTQRVRRHSMMVLCDRGRHVNTNSRTCLLCGT